MYTRTVMNGDYRIISLLCGLAGFHNKRYVYPSQEWMIKKLQQFYGRKISRSTLCRHVAALERDGYLKRTKRHTRDKNGGILFRSTLYQITRKALRFASYMAGCLQLKGKNTNKPPKTEPCAAFGTISSPSGRDYSRDRESHESQGTNYPSKKEGQALFKNLRDKLLR